MLLSGRRGDFSTVLCGDVAAPRRDAQRKSVAAAYSLVIQLFAALALALTFSQARADINDSRLNLFERSTVQQRYFYVSLYTTHYDPEPDHVNDQQMLGFEFEMKGNRLLGLALFDNSFGQESQYLYMGKKWHLFKSDRWYVKLTGGLLHGYEEPYEDKIPLNDFGVAPAIIPAIGIRHKKFFAEFAQLGFAAGMLNVGVTF